MRRLARGDVSALGELYDRYAVDLLRFACRVANPQDAEDVVQASFMRVAHLAASYDERAETARPWLMGITARIIQERRRAFGRFRRALLSFAGFVERSADANPPSPRSDLERGLAALSDAKRVVIVLAEIEGYTCEEIAQMLEIPVGTVWTRLHHARKELRAFFTTERE